MESKKVIVIGASGHGRVIADIISASGDHFVGFLDDDTSKSTLGVISNYEKFRDCWFVLGIGDSEIREKLSSLPVKWYTAIHPSSVISVTASVGEGSVVMANSVINANARIGKHTIINTTAVVEHDNKIGDFSHISVGAKLGGNVTIGTRCWIGIGSTINNNVLICDSVVIGAGTVVIHTIDENGTYVGVPARRLYD